MNVMDEVIIICAGMNSFKSKLNDLWTININKMEWIEVKTAHNLIVEFNLWLFCF